MTTEIEAALNKVTSVLAVGKHKGSSPGLWVHHERARKHHYYQLMYTDPRGSTTPVSDLVSRGEMLVILDTTYHLCRLVRRDYACVICKIFFTPCTPVGLTH